MERGECGEWMEGGGKESDWSELSKNGMGEWRGEKWREGESDERNGGREEQR